MTRPIVVLAVAVAGLAILTLVGFSVVRPALADGAKPTATTATAIPAVSPVVAAFAYRTDTEYEPDPFETTRLRRSRTTVTHVLLVRADGTQEIKATNQ